jgi:hypothetical protein
MRGIANSCEHIEEVFIYQVHNRMEFRVQIKVKITTLSIIYLIKKNIFTR